MAPSTRSPTRPTIGVTRARQGRLGRNILWVLLVALVLVVLGFFAAWTWKSRDLASVEPNNGTERVDARAFNAPPPTPASRQNYQVGGPLAPQNHGNPGQPDRSKTAEP
ncbi:MAG: hypothetical protein JWQ97_339 [Phenylobacterium sp.]|nr:hypothetical protein [Phenylobacterium sp.]